MSTYDHRGNQRKLFRTLEPEVALAAHEYKDSLFSRVRQVARENNYTQTPELLEMVEKAKQHCIQWLNSHNLVDNVYNWVHQCLKRLHVVKPANQDTVKNFVAVDMAPVAKEILWEIKNDSELSAELDNDPEFDKLSKRFKGGKDQALLYLAAHAAAGVASSLYVQSVLGVIYKAYSKNPGKFDSLHNSYLGKLSNPASCRNLQNTKMHGEGGLAFVTLPK
jgi:hypothetical protein